MKVARVPHDSFELRGLHKATFPADRMPRWQAGWHWLVTDEVGPCAFGSLQPSARWSDTVYLVRSGVLPRARGRGLQKRLIRVRERFAKSIGMRWVITDTTDNPASANSLIACGFKMFQPTAPWGGKTTVYWRKQLQSD